MYREKHNRPSMAALGIIIMIGGAAIAATGSPAFPRMDEEPTPVGVPKDRLVNPSEKRSTACRGEVEIWRMRRELLDVRYQGANKANMPQIEDKMPIAEKETIGLKDEFDHATCADGIDVRTKDIQNNTIVPCYEPVTIGQFSEIMGIDQSQKEKRFLRPLLEEFRLKNCPEIVVYEAPRV